VTRSGPGCNPQWRRDARGPNGRSLCRWCLAEVPKRSRTWCSNNCVTAFKAENDWATIKGIVRRRSGGLCALCGCDAKGSHGGFEFDHVVPIADGGAFGAENVRMLCVPCHRRVTREWRRQRAARAAITEPTKETP
jgi:5-methylcytosine-specific restriction endonuclease McrA